MSTSPVESVLRLARAADDLFARIDAGEQIPIPVLREFAEAVERVPLAAWNQAVIPPGAPDWRLELRSWARTFLLEWGGSAFTEALADVEQMAEELGDRPFEHPAFMQAVARMVEMAPSKFREIQRELAADWLPPASHVDQDGKPLWTVQELADATGRTPEQVMADIEQLGFQDGLHSGPTHRLQ